MNPSGVDTNPEGWSKKTEKRPIEPVIDNIAALAWAFRVGEIWHYRFVSDPILRLTRPERGSLSIETGSTIALTER